MSWGLGLRVRVWLRTVLVGLVVAALCGEAAAEVKVTVNKRDHVVQGTTAASLVRSMNGAAAIAANPRHLRRCARAIENSAIGATTERWPRS